MKIEITDEIFSAAFSAGHGPTPHWTLDSVYQQFDLKQALQAALPLIRDAVLEEAAAIASRRDLSPMSNNIADVTAREIAAIIRALKTGAAP